MEVRHSATCLGRRSKGLDPGVPALQNGARHRNNLQKCKHGMLLVRLVVRTRVERPTLLLTLHYSGLTNVQVVEGIFPTGGCR